MMNRSRLRVCILYENSEWDAALVAELCMPVGTCSMPVALLDEDGATRPAPRLSGNTKSLLMMFVLFTSITAAQWVGAVWAHSLALQARC